MLKHTIILGCMAAAAWSQEPTPRAFPELEEQAREMAEQAKKFKEQFKEDSRFQAEHAKALAEHAKEMTKWQPEAMKMQMDAARLMKHDLQLSFMLDQDVPMPPMPPKAVFGAPAPAPMPAPFAFAFQPGRPASDDDRTYRSGKNALDERDWERAIEQFQRLIDRKSAARSDAAMYWKAYAQNRLGRRSEAQATLAEMMRAHPGSRWLDDAKALEVEVKQSSGQPVSPEMEADEDLKLIALQGMSHSDPERAAPLIENLIRKSNSPRLKDRAVYVLAQNRSPQTRDVLLKLAKGGVNPDLQYKAVEYLGYHNSPETRQALAEIYSASNDVSLKRAVLRGFAASRDKEKLFTFAKGESMLDLRREAIRGLGSADANTELWQLYQGETNVDLKMDILRALPGRKENVEKLVEAFKTEKEPKVQRELIAQIGYTRAPKVSDTLASLYQSTSDAGIKKSIISSLQQSNNAKALIDIAKAETDIKLKRSAVEALSHMKSKEATDFLVELLNK